MFRFIDTGENNGAMNMAIDEALLIAQHKSGLPPVIRVYKFVPPTLSIGYFQSMEKEIDIDNCEKLGFGYVRRPTGGRAVLHDKELTYSVTIAYPHSILEMSLLDSFKFISEGIIRAIEKLGAKANFSQTEEHEIANPSCFAHPTFSDILINGKKVVGSAQMRNKIGLLQHGAILYRVNIDDVFACFKLDEKQRTKGVEIGRERISSLSDESGREISFNEVKKALREGMQEVLDDEIVEEKITDKEEEISQFLYKNKYNTKEWNFKK